MIEVLVTPANAVRVTERRLSAALAEAAPRSM